MPAIFFLFAVIVLNIKKMYLFPVSATLPMASQNFLQTANLIEIGWLGCLVSNPLFPTQGWVGRIDYTA
jgi:hypothetical protein